jgi:hypothetical protein
VTARADTSRESTRLQVRRRAASVSDAVSAQEVKGPGRRLPPPENGVAPPAPMDVTADCMGAFEPGGDDRSAGWTDFPTDGSPPHPDARNTLAAGAFGQGSGAHLTRGGPHLSRTAGPT